MWEVVYICVREYVFPWCSCGRVTLWGSYLQCLLSSCLHISNQKLDCFLSSTSPHPPLLIHLSSAPWSKDWHRERERELLRSRVAYGDRLDVPRIGADVFGGANGFEVVFRCPPPRQILWTRHPPQATSTMGARLLGYCTIGALAHMKIVSSVDFVGTARNEQS